MVPNTGDTVFVRKFILDRWYEATGKVTEIRRDTRTDDLAIRVNNDWWPAESDYLNTVRIIPPANAHCRYCGQTGDELEPVDVRTAYGEDGEEDDAGCFVEHRTEWRCKDRRACRQFVAEMYRMAAETSHLVGLEAGMNGRIGGGVSG